MKVPRWKVVFVAVISAGTAVVTQAPASLADARRAIGSQPLRSATIEFSYKTLLSSEITGGNDATIHGTGILMYSSPGQYRLERVMSPSNGRRTLNVAVDDGNEYARWWVANGRTQRAPLGAATTADRTRLEREVLVYLTALLLPADGFMTYRQGSAAGSYAVTGPRGSSAEILVADRRLREIRYDKLLATPIALTPGGSSVRRDVVARARAQVSDFRTVGDGVAPYRFRAEYEHGWEELTIERYTLNVPIPSSQFRPPPAVNRK